MLLLLINAYSLIVSIVFDLFLPSPMFFFIACTRFQNLPCRLVRRLVRNIFKICTFQGIRRYFNILTLKGFFSSRCVVSHHKIDFLPHKAIVSGQNTIGIYIIPLASIQYTAQKQNMICNTQLLKLQLAVTNKMLYSTTGCQNYSRL